MLMTLAIIISPPLVHLWEALLERCDVVALSLLLVITRERKARNGADVLIDGIGKSCYY